MKGYKVVDSEGFNRIRIAIAELSGFRKNSTAVRAKALTAGVALGYVARSY